VNEIEIRRLYLTARDRAQNHPLRQMVRNALRAMGTRRLSTEATRLFDDILGPWESESIQKVVAHLTAKEEDLVLGVALEYSKITTKLAAKNRGGKGGKKKPDRAARDRWICERYRAAKTNNPKYSWECLRMDLKKSRKFVKELRRDGEFIGAEALRRIVKKHPDLA
jgi:hypothetical protein